MIRNYERNEAAEAAITAVGGRDNLMKPPHRRLRLTVRCEKGHLLGHVVSTRIGPVFVARVERPRARVQLEHKPEINSSLARISDWDFGRITKFSFHSPRCTCGDPPEGPVFAFEIPTEALELLDDGGRSRLVARVLPARRGPGFDPSFVEIIWKTGA